jgi:hypothetical protein
MNAQQELYHEQLRLRMFRAKRNFLKFEYNHQADFHSKLCADIRQVEGKIKETETIVEKLEDKLMSEFSEVGNDEQDEVDQLAAKFSRLTLSDDH